MKGFVYLSAFISFHGVAVSAQYTPIILGSSDFGETLHEVRSLGGPMYYGFVRSEVGTAFSTYAITKLDSGGQPIDTIDIDLPDQSYNSSCLLPMPDNTFLSIGTWVYQGFWPHARIGLIRLDQDLNIIDSTSFAVNNTLAEIPDAILLNDSLLGMVVTRADFPSLVDTSSIVIYNLNTGEHFEYVDPTIHFRARDIAWHDATHRLVGLYTNSSSNGNSVTTQLLEVDPFLGTSTVIDLPFGMDAPIIYGNIANSSGCFFNDTGELTIVGRVEAAAGDGGGLKTGVVRLDQQYLPLHSAYLAYGDSVQHPPVYDVALPLSNGRTLVVINKSPSIYQPFNVWTVRTNLWILDDSLQVICHEEFRFLGYNYIWQVRMADNGDLLLGGIHVEPGATQLDALIYRIPMPTCFVGIGEFDPSSFVRVFPTDGGDWLTVVMDEGMPDATFEVLDASGRMIISLSELAQRTRIALTGLAAGPYLWRMRERTSEYIARGKWIKEP